MEPSPYDTYRYAFESCRSYKDGAVHQKDFASICQRFRLNCKQAMEVIGKDTDGRIRLDAFIQFLKSYHSHPGSYYDQDYRPKSPGNSRPSSGSKMHRQAVYPHVRHSTRYPMSPTTTSGAFDQPDVSTDDPKRQLTRQELNRTPDFFLSPDEPKPPPAPSTGRAPHGLEKMRATDHHDYPHAYRSPATPHSTSRPALESPPPPPPPSSSGLSSHHMTRRGMHARSGMGPGGDMVSGRSDKAKSYKGEESEDEVEINPDNFFPPPAPTSSRRSTGCKHCKATQRQMLELQDDLKATRTERERLEQNNERLRKDLQIAQNSDLAYAQLYRENEKLRQEIHALKRMKKDSSDPDSDRAFFDRQYEELKKVKEELEEEVHNAKTSLKAYKKECNALKAEYNNIRLKNEELQRANWRLVDDNQRLTVKLMDDDKASVLSRRQQGDGGSEDQSKHSSFASDVAFQRQTTLRQTYHGRGGEVSKDSSSSRRKPRLDMKRTSSAGQALDYDEAPPIRDQDKDCGYSYSRAKSHKSATSDAASVVEGIGLSLVSTTPDEQSQVFMVLGEDVSKSVLPEGLGKDKELAMMYALQNCHSVQEVIKRLVSYGVSTSSDQLQGLEVDNEHLSKRIEHMKSKQATLENSFQVAKANMEKMYLSLQKVEANNMCLRHALRLCQQTCEVFEVLNELKIVDHRNPSSSANYFPSFEGYSPESSTRSPDREQVSIKHSASYRARSLLHSLDSNTELQHYLPIMRTSRQVSGDYNQPGGHWSGTLSQNTGTTSGLSSMSGGMEGDISHNEIERLRQYTQALLHYKNHLLSTLVTLDGMKGIEILKKYEVGSDCQASVDSSDRIIDLEDAANAEELCKVREEKAELRSQIYMMDQEKRRMELDTSRMLLHKMKSDRLIAELQFMVKEERRKRKKERKGRKGEASIPPHESNHMSEIAIEYTSALEREKELGRRYEELFGFMQNHVKGSQETTDELMRFVKELRRANSALVDAFEKSKKRQQAEKKRIKQELVSYMNRVQSSSGPTNEELPNGTIYA